MNFINIVNVSIFLFLLKNTCNFLLATFPQETIDFFDHICKTEKSRQLALNNETPCGFNIFLICDPLNPLALSHISETFNKSSFNELFDQVRSKYPLSSITEIKQIKYNGSSVVKYESNNIYNNIPNGQQTSKENYPNIESTINPKQGNKPDIQKNDRIQIIIASKKACEDISCVSFFPAMDEIAEFVQTSKQSLREALETNGFLHVLKNENYHILSYDFNQIQKENLNNSLIFYLETNIQKKNFETYKLSLGHFWEKLNVSKKLNKKSNLSYASANNLTRKSNTANFLTSKINGSSEIEIVIQNSDVEHESFENIYSICSNVDEVCVNFENNDSLQQNQLDSTLSFKKEKTQEERTKIIKSMNQTLKSLQAGISMLKELNKTFKNEILSSSISNITEGKFYDSDKDGYQCNEICKISKWSDNKTIKKYRRCFVDCYCKNKFY
jgi:hypothetical protein